MPDAPIRRGIPALAMLLGLLAALVLGELVLRALRPAALAVVRYPCVYEPDPELGFRYTPGASGLVSAHFEIHNQVEINHLGFYDEEPGPADAAPRLLAVGDSFTAAMNVPKPDVWTSVLERALREAGRSRADVVNLGQDGTGSDVHLDLLRRYLPRLRSDAVVLAFYANDPADVMHGRFRRECYEGYVLSYQSDAQREALRARVAAHRSKRWRVWLHEHSYLARLLAALVLPRGSPYRLRFQQPRLAELGPAASDPAQGARRLGLALDGLEALAASCRCRLWVVPVPPRSDPGGSLGVWRRVAAGRALETIDVLPAFERLREERGLSHGDLYFVHDNHLNRAGNEIFGRALAEALLPSL